MDRSELEQTVKDDAGDPAFAELAELMILSGDLQEALQVCIKGLSIAPDVHKGRLMLARVFFELEALPFAAREVKVLLDEFPDNKFLRRLYEKLCPDMAGVSDSREEYETTDDSEEVIVDDTVAEAEFDFDSLDLLEGEDD